MCGIVGLVNVDKTIQVSRKNWFYDALYVDQLRGEDSTGIYVQEKATFAKPEELPAPVYYKRALAAADFLRLENTKQMLKNTDDCLVALGHNRYATQGISSEDDNAHPFHFGTITMVHNGTLDTRKGLDTNYTVDSCAIAKQLSVTKPSEYTKLLSQLEGAFVLVWINTDTNTVYLTRNTERPLWCGL